jgi:riboflavin kinase/FMN adenylyltransferase
MKIISPDEIIDFETAVTIGMFDGVHLGHAKLIEETISIASLNNLKPVVFTFFNHPVKEKVRNYINVLDEKLYLLEKSGIDTVYLAELDDAFMKIEGDVFFQKYIVDLLKSKAVIVGEDFRFGFNRAYDVKLLNKLSKNSSILVKTIPLISVDGKPVKSSAIHSYLTEGLIGKANKLLGYEFFLSGNVVRGKGLGRHIGFPTANIHYLNGSKVLPKNGIYVTLGEIDDILHQSVTNVGLNPTFDKDNKIKVETYFLDMHNDLYEKFVRLHFLSRIRDEERFASPSELKKSISNDVDIAKKYFSKS